jgi:ABC-type molybdate transport system substrate-binding protein
LLKPLIAFLTVVGNVGSVNAGWLDKMQSMWSEVAGKSQSLYEENWASLPGTIRICATKELQEWIVKDVIESFKKKAPLISVTIEAHGSGELVDAMNAGNTMQCDILIPGSDVAAMRWKDYNIKNRIPVAYSPTVWVGDKEKFAAAREFLKKAADASLSCSDLSQVAVQKRYSKIKQGGKGKLDLEMTTSNSGQSMYVSCVYSIVDALDPEEVEDKLNKNPALEEQVRTFFKEVIFQQDSTTTLTIKPEGQFVHPNGIGYKHLAIATYESFLPQLEQEFTKQGKVMEVIYPSVIILNNFPAVRITTEGKNGKATQAFMDYLLGADAQTALLQFGFRPANPKIDYSSYPVSKYFRNDIEIGDAPATQQLLRDLWDIVSNMPGVQTVKF